jgi:hypothetical protein
MANKQKDESGDVVVPMGGDQDLPLSGPQGSVGFSGEGPSTNGAGPGLAPVPGDRIDHSVGLFSGNPQKATAKPGGGRADT